MRKVDKTIGISWIEKALIIIAAVVLQSGAVERVYGIGRHETRIAKQLAKNTILPCRHD
jgi:hypothetical protein